MLVCIICRKSFCCPCCRRNHETNEHKLKYDCSLCRNVKFLCTNDNLTNTDLLMHIKETHLPLHCNKCGQLFENIADFADINKCDSSESENEVRSNNLNEAKEVKQCFDSVYERAKSEINTDDSDDMEAIVSFDPMKKVATVTPLVKGKTMIEESSSEDENCARKVILTPYPKKVVKFQRNATPYVRKSVLTKLSTKYSDSLEDYETKECDSVTPSRCISILKDVLKTPTSHLMKDLNAPNTVTTSTPTHPSNYGQWTPFPGTNNDSPLSEIGSNAGDSASNATVESLSIGTSDTSKPKLKSIIVKNGSRCRLESQDSGETKAVTFIDSPTEVTNESSNIKKVKFAKDTKFETDFNPSRRVFRRPKRMLTPGAKRIIRHSKNPRFQAILNQFENQTGYSIVQTPNNRETTPELDAVNTIPARAIDFKQGNETGSVEEVLNTPELYKTCLELETPVANRITSFSSNIASSIQNYLSTALSTCEETTEIQFKFVISKKSVSVRKLECEPGVTSSTEEFDTGSRDGGSVWSVITKAVKNVIWGADSNKENEDTGTQTTINKTPSSVTRNKRKYEDILDYNSPLCHKRHKYEGRIKGRRPIDRMLNEHITNKVTQSADHETLWQQMNYVNDNNMNQSF